MGGKFGGQTSHLVLKPCQTMNATMLLLISCKHPYFADAVWGMEGTKWETGGPCLPLLTPEKSLKCTRTTDLPDHDKAV